MGQRHCVAPSVSVAFSRRRTSRRCRHPRRTSATRGPGHSRPVPHRRRRNASMIAAGAPDRRRRRRTTPGRPTFCCCFSALAPADPRADSPPRRRLGRSRSAVGTPAMRISAPWAVRPWTADLRDSARAGRWTSATSISVNRTNPTVAAPPDRRTSSARTIHRSGKSCRRWSCRCPTCSSPTRSRMIPSRRISPFRSFRCAENRSTSRHRRGRRRRVPRHRRPRRHPRPRSSPR